MPNDAMPSDMRREAAINATAVHATAVAIDGRALLIVGPSRSGKSTLAAALMSSAHRRRIELVGDDRILLTFRQDGGIIARPHPRIAGFIERRGLGLVAVAYRPSAPVVGTIDLGPATTRRLASLDRPVLNLVHVENLDCRRDLVCRWLPTICGAALGSHSIENSGDLLDRRETSQLVNRVRYT